MTLERDVDIRRREAAGWFARLNQRKVERQDIVDFSRWRRDPANAAAFSRLEGMWATAETVAHDPEMVALAADAEAALIAPKSQTRRRRIIGDWRPVSAAVAIVVTLGLGLAVWSIQPRTTETRVGETRTITLADGSRVTLDTATRISVRMTGGTRRIELVAGQAFFDVARDPSRPFIVEAGGTRVTALGTRFDVRRLSHGARVILVEGRVRVTEPGDDAWELSPGQQVRTDAARPAPIAVNADQAVSWTQGRLVFDRTPVSEAIAEVNRYSAAPIELRASSIGDIPVSGAFDAGDIPGFVSALTELYPVTAERTPAGGYILRDAPKKNS